MQNASILDDDEVFGGLLLLIHYYIIAHSRSVMNQLICDF